MELVKGAQVSLPPLHLLKDMEDIGDISQKFNVISKCHCNQGGNKEEDRLAKKGIVWQSITSLDVVPLQAQSCTECHPG